MLEWSPREVSPLLNSHSVFEARSSMSEGCAYRFGQLLVNLSERWDYLKEFKCSVRRVWVENMAVRVNYTTVNSKIDGNHNTKMN